LCKIRNLDISYFCSDYNFTFKKNVMKTLKFKTNINCGNCVAKVTPFLNKEEDIISWKVDTSDPEKILTVEAEGIDEEYISSVIEKAGFKAVSE
jgi:copper chaperone